MRRILTRIFGHKANANRRGRQKKSALQVEALESRWCPSTTAVLSNGNTLVIRGDDARNVVSITQDDKANTLTVVGDGVTRVFSSSQVTNIDVDLKGGNDLFFYGLPRDKDFSRAKSATIRLGDGKDECRLDFRGDGLGFRGRLLANLAITVDAGKGDDIVDGNFNGKHTGALKMTAIMGDGNDVASAGLWDDVTGGANVLFDLKGGLGNDTLFSYEGQVNFANRLVPSQSIDVTSGSAVTIKMDGGFGNDKVAVFPFSGELDGALTLDLHGGAGNDTVSADVFLKSGSTGSVNAKVQGDVGNDHMHFRLRDNSVRRVKILEALLHGNDGADLKSSTTTSNVTVLSCQRTPSGQNPVDFSIVNEILARHHNPFGQPNNPLEGGNTEPPGGKPGHEPKFD